MEQRIDMLEREVGAIKADIAVIKTTYFTREEMRAFDTRLARIEGDIVILKNDVEKLKDDVEQLRKGVEQLKKDVLAINEELVAIRKELAQIRLEQAQMRQEQVLMRQLQEKMTLELVEMRAEHPGFATKVDLFQQELRLKTWIVGAIFSALTLMTAIQIGLYNAFVR